MSVTRRPFLSPARCCICGFRIAAMQPVHSTVARDKYRTLLVAHKDCAS